MGTSNTAKTLKVKHGVLRGLNTMWLLFCRPIRAAQTILYLSTTWSLNSLYKTSELCQEN